MESVGQLCISLEALAPVLGRAVCWVDVGGKAGMATSWLLWVLMLEPEK